MAVCSVCVLVCVYYCFFTVSDVLCLFLFSLYLGYFLVLLFVYGDVFDVCVRCVVEWRCGFLGDFLVVIVWWGWCWFFGVSFVFKRFFCWFLFLLFCRLLSFFLRSHMEIWLSLNHLWFLVSFSVVASLLFDVLVCVVCCFLLITFVLLVSRYALLISFYVIHCVFLIYVMYVGYYVWSICSVVRGCVFGVVLWWVLLLFCSSVSVCIFLCWFWVVFVVPGVDLLLFWVLVWCCFLFYSLWWVCNLLRLYFDIDGLLHFSFCSDILVSLFSFVCGIF